FAPPEEKKKGNKSTKPKLFVGPVVAEPVFKKGDAYKVKPAKDVRPIPKFSRRALLPESMTSPENRRFARTAVNRLWEMMMGRGLVHPVDFDHNGNPPSHPELLDVLTDEFISHRYDIKWFLRELTLSKTYQRSSRVVPGEGQSEAIPTESFAQAVLKPLTPAQFCWAVLQAVGETDVQRHALNETLTEEALHNRLVEHENRFVGLFGGQPGNPPREFQSTLNQVLFLSNSPELLNLLKPKQGNLSDRLGKLPIDNPQAVAAELFLSVLTRPPTSEETQEIAEYLEGLNAESRTAALSELIWALVASSEFRFNH
ncbi:MAG: DUF1553 domain-containing protein, partial [Planctomycetes bacterium]|nr:DUF1553 domain-containing protein [Planctomycetota bacterium]